MIKTWHRIKKALTLPLPVVFKYGKEVVKRRLMRMGPVVLERELLGGILPKTPSFPLGIFRAHMTGAKETADVICRHEFDLLGSGLKKLGTQIDWQRDFKHDFSFPLIRSERITYNYPPGRDIKVSWELSRFQFLFTLIHAYETHDDERYAREARDLIHDWILKNPIGYGVNWKCTMDVAIRACNWAVAWAFLQDCPAWKDTAWQRAFLTSIVEHGKFIVRNLEVGPGFNSNHYLSDITGLIFLGILFPQFKEAQLWLKTGVEGLEHEMQMQVYEDGFDFEASISYHRLVTEFFGFSAQLCRENGVELSKVFWERLEKMFGFAESYTKPNGLAPQIGDNDDGRLFIFEDFSGWNRRDHSALAWMARSFFPLRETSTALESKAFHHGGVYTMRTQAFFCIVDCGHNGQKGNAGHAHNDTLSFELSCGGVDYIVDPGTYVYTSDPTARNLFRSTRMHNTVMVDGQEMNRFRADTLFSMHDDAHPTVHTWESDTEHDLLDASHDGYARMPGDVIHRRRFLLDKMTSALEITDHFTGDGTHTLEWNFHFAPNVVVGQQGAFIKASVGTHCLIIEVPHGLAESILIHEGEVSPSYGVKEPAQVLTLHIEAQLPTDGFTFRFIPQ